MFGDEETSASFKKIYFSIFTTYHQKFKNLLPCKVDFAYTCCFDMNIPLLTFAFPKLSPHTDGIIITQLLLMLEILDSLFAIFVIILIHHSSIISFNFFNLSCHLLCPFK